MHTPFRKLKRSVIGLLVECKNEFPLYSFFFWGVRGEEGSVETVSFGAMKECYLLQKPHC